jgi:flagellin
MGLRIRTNIQSINAQRRLESTTHDLGESMAKMASGYRINKAADDSAGLAISEQNRAFIRSLSQAKRNAMDGVSMLQVAEGGMNEVSNILIRLRELSTQAASDTISNTERSFTNREYSELVDEVDRITATTEFNGIYLLRGGNKDGDPMEDFTIHVGAGAEEGIDTLKVDLKSMVIQTYGDDGLGLSSEGAQIGPAIGDDPKTSDFTRGMAAEKLKVLDGALSKINGMRATLGAKQNRLNSTISNISIAHENISAANSRIRDVDYAEETASFTQSKILQQECLFCHRPTISRKWPYHSCEGSTFGPHWAAGYLGDLGIFLSEHGSFLRPDPVGFFLLTGS